MDRRGFLQAGALVALGSSATFRARGGTRPVPTAAQLKWHRRELAMFLHFGINTFTDREWGDGTEDPRLFMPTDLDARQWTRAAKAGGFRTVVLTAKHHDGFCLWPSRLTSHTVASSGWRDGRGDIVGDLAAAARADGLGLGLYLSPWDRHEPSYGDSPRYNDFYCAQLTELLTRYGPVAEVWFDGANGEGPNGRRQAYDWPRIHRVVRSLQPNALIFSDAGPDLRWAGNENGVAGDPNWCTVDPAAVPYPGADGDRVISSLQHGDPAGSVWRPAESDVSIRPGWFWHEAEDAKVRTADNLIDLYCTSVGKNSGLLLNVPPTRAGRIHEMDVSRLRAFAELREALFDPDLLRHAKAVTATGSASAAHVLDPDPATWWSPPEGVTSAQLEVRLRRPVTFNRISLQEAIRRGQTVSAYSLDAWSSNVWSPVSTGTTIGYRKIDRIRPTTTSRLRLSVTALDTPRIARIELGAA